MPENEHKYWPRKNKMTYSYFPHTILGFGKICKCFSYVLIHTFYLFILGKNISTICHRSPVNSTTGRMSTLCFDPSRHFITNLKETPSASISSYTATTVGDDVYLIGGRDSGTFTNKVDQVTDTALKFSLSTKKWQELCPIPSKIVHHQAAVFKRVLYVCGGITVSNGEPVVSRKTYAYDTEVNMWMSRCDMNDARRDFHLEVVADKLVASGGKNAASECVTTVEIYDRIINQWMILNGPGTYQFFRPVSLVREDITIVVGDNKDGESADTWSGTVTTSSVKRQVLSVEGGQ